MYLTAAMSSRRNYRRSTRLALSALLLTSVTASLNVHEAQSGEEEIYYLPRSAVIHDGFVHKPLSTCPVKPGGVQMSYTFPWTHTPSCVNIQQPEGAPKTFCAYTNVNYNNGRGISFVTSPEVAASVSMETFGMAIGGMEGQIGEEMGMWEVKDAGSKGKGLFAKKDIGAIFPGESLVVQTPVLIVDKSALEPESKEEVERVLLTAVAQLPSKSRKMAVELSGNEDGSFEDIVKTNGIGFTWPWVDEMPKLLSVTPEIAVSFHGVYQTCRTNFDSSASIMHAVPTHFGASTTIHLHSRCLRSKKSSQARKSHGAVRVNPACSKTCPTTTNIFQMVLKGDPMDVVSALSRPTSGSPARALSAPPQTRKSWLQMIVSARSKL